MKNLIPFLFLFSLACQETVYEEVEKIVRDTVQTTKTDTVFIDRVFWKVDTVELRTVTTETDTFFIATVDSVFIYETIYQTDTIYKYTVIETFRDTFPYFPTRTVYSVPKEVQPIVTRFYNECAARGILVTGGNLFVTLWPDDDFPPANRSSRTFTVWAHGQWVIQVVSSVDYPHYFSPLFRELAHSQLNKPYTNEPDDMMNPSFDPFKLTLESPEAQYYIDKLFAQ